MQAVNTSAFPIIVYAKTVYQQPWGFEKVLSVHNLSLKRGGDKTVSKPQFALQGATCLNLHKIFESALHWQLLIG
jgi:hypothetical protein